MGKAIITLKKGDITTLAVDAIVNAANSSLLGGGGVDGAIHGKGGRQILEECRAIRNQHGPCATGEAVYTSAGLLPSRYVIHTVGPVWNGGQAKEAELLAACYENALRIANELGVRTLAFPNISTGIYRYPKAQAAEVAIHAVKAFLNAKNKSIKEVQFVCFDDENYEIYRSIMDQSSALAETLAIQIELICSRLTDSNFPELFQEGWDLIHNFKSQGLLRTDAYETLYSQHLKYMGTETFKMDLIDEWLDCISGYLGNKKLHLW